MRSVQEGYAVILNKMNRSGGYSPPDTLLPVTHYRFSFHPILQEYEGVPKESIDLVLETLRKDGYDAKVVYNDSSAWRRRGREYNGYDFRIVINETKNPGFLHKAIWRFGWW